MYIYNQKSKRISDWRSASPNNIFSNNDKFHEYVHGKNVVGPSWLIARYNVEITWRSVHNHSAYAYRASLISWCRWFLNTVRLLAQTVEAGSEFQTCIHLIVKKRFLMSVFVTGGKIFVAVSSSSVLIWLLKYISRRDTGMSIKNFPTLNEVCSQ